MCDDVVYNINQEQHRFSGAQNLDAFISSVARSAEVRPLESFDPPPRPLQFLLEESADGRSELHGYAMLCKIDQ